MASKPNLDRRQRIYWFIVEHWLRVGFPASIREISRGTGIRSTSAVKYHLDALVEEDLLIRHTPGGWVRPTAIKAILQEDEV